MQTGVGRLCEARVFAAVEQRAITAYFLSYCMLASSKQLAYFLGELSGVFHLIESVRVAPSYFFSSSF